jgi:polyhydroxybutyrate depolymerase
LIVVFVLSGCLDQTSGIDPLPADSAAPGWHEGTLRHDGLERDYRFYVPGNLATPASVVLLLHGGTQSMDKLFRPNAGGSQAWRAVADTAGFLLVVPNGTDLETNRPEGSRRHWNDCRPEADIAEAGPGADDVGFLAALLDHMRRQFAVDTDRLYVTGASNGGMMSYRLARTLDERLAAAAVFIANQPANGSCPDPERAVPLLIANGTADPLTPYGGGALARSDRGTVRSTQATVDYWAARHGIRPNPSAVDSLPDRTSADDSRIIRYRYGASSPKAPLVLYKMQGAGHAMPSIAHPLPRTVEWILGRQNHDVEGAALAWRFLRRWTR